MALTAESEQRMYTKETRGIPLWRRLDLDGSSMVATIIQVMPVCLQEKLIDYEQLYSLDVLGVEDRGENDKMQVLSEFRENITRQEDGRYQVSIPWIPGSKLTATNEQQSRTRLYNVNKKLAKDEKLRQEYEKIIEDQLTNGVIERSPEKPSGVYYMSSVLHAT